MKFTSRFKRNKIIVVSGEDREEIGQRISQILSKKFKIKKFVEKTPSILDFLTNQILIIESDLQNAEFFGKVVNLLNLSESPALAVSEIQNSHLAQIKKLVQILPLHAFLVLNYDEENIKKIGQSSDLKRFSFGFAPGADFIASDEHINSHMTNFKLNYRGKSIPVWLENVIGKKYIYNALAASCVATFLGMNFVEITEALKNCKLYSGKVE